MPNLQNFKKHVSMFIRADLLLDIVLGIVTGHPLTLIAMAALLGLSATFSGCETSLFSLSAPQLNRIRAGCGRLDRIIASLHANLKSLLPSILFCNMAVNVMVYALSASITAELGARFGTGVAFLSSLFALFFVVFWGEVFPKQLAISSSLLVARATSFQVWLFYRALSRPMRLLTGMVSALERVLAGNRSDSRELREEELRLLVELSKADGVISEGEYELIDGIVELPDVRIRDVMIHRMDVPALPPDATPTRLVEAARKERHCKIPVLDADLAEIAGWVDAREVYAARFGRSDFDGGERIDAYLNNFQFFSEHDRADQVLERIKGGGGDLYAVVDERGQLIGFFTMQDIMDEVLGRFGENGAPPPTEVREQDGLYIISGLLRVREWRELFNVGQAVPKSSTVGGLVVSLLGRMARRGDTVRLENMEMTVRATWRNRVTEVGLRLIAPATAPGTAGEES